MLIKCPECDKEVSDVAKSCPHCGFPIENIENVVDGSQKNNGVHYARPTQSLRPKEETNGNKGKGLFWVFLVVIAFGMASCMSDFYSSDEPDNLQELSTDDFDTYDEYAESKEIVTEETDIEETTEEPQKEVPEIPMEEYIAQCQEQNYKDVLRNPSDYVGQKVKVVVEISSVHEASWLYNDKYYLAWSKGEYGYYTGDYYAIIDKRYDNSLKLLDEDVILVYGEIAEPEEIKSYIVNSEEVFAIDMRYVELLDE